MEQWKLLLLHYLAISVFVIYVSYLHHIHDKVAVLSLQLLKRKLWRRCFPVDFAKFQEHLFSQNTSGRLLLHVYTRHLRMTAFDLYFELSSLEKALPMARNVSNFTSVYFYLEDSPTSNPIKIQ